MSLLDFLYPVRCVGCGKTGTYFCALCRERLPKVTGQICPMCARPAIGGMTHARCRKQLGLDGLVSVYAYRAVMQRAIKKFKFRLVRDLAETMAGLTLDGWRQNDLVTFWRRERFGVMPVPLHPVRLRWRGFNQAEELGKRVAKGMGLPFAAGVLKRTKKTESQAEMKVRLTQQEEQRIREKSVSRLDFEEKLREAVKEKKRLLRSKNVQGAFGAEKKMKAGTRVILVDDVWTTGATMRECGKVLKRAGAERVWGLTMAR
ncbi:MAG: ComF family protein [Candidatus Chisholmbacteria bacterium]|nr:ComF family protein [Candidatus Chisholmbacteria bacterium]